MIKVPEQITDAKGIDLIIQSMQNHLSSQLDWLQFSFSRAYRNQDAEGNFYPEVYVSDKEYLNVFAADTTNSMSFFDVSETRTFDRENTATYYNNEQEVKIIFFVNLDKAKNVNYRADELINLDIQTAIENYGSKLAVWEIQSLQTGIDNVYSNYNYNGTVTVNYEQYYIVTFNTVVKFRNATYC